jgi:hypothetical protein
MPGGPHISARLSVPGGNKCFRSISSHTLPCTETLDIGYHSAREKQTTPLKSAAGLEASASQNSTATSRAPGSTLKAPRHV